MTPDRWQEVKDGLAHALALEGEERDAYLAAIRTADPDLCGEVEQLLAYSQPADAFLEHPAVPGTALSAGTTFGAYEIQSPLGTGGMGAVFLARERTLDRPVALKFLSAALQQDRDARHRFLQEARAAAALDHPYICKIFQTGEEAGRPFIAMEYIRGETLHDRLAVARLELPHVLQIALEVVEALEAAHAAQIVHRDLKPSNIMLTADRHVKVLDFGLAKRVGPGGGQNPNTDVETQTGVIQGTVAYMSPEQLRGQDVDARSDIFSLGIVLYEMTSGVHPFKANVPIDTSSRILHHTPAPLDGHTGPMPPLLDHVVRKMLAKEREDRYQSVRELRTDLTHVMALVEHSDAPTSTAVGHPDAGGPSRWTAPSRRAAVAGIISIAILLGAVSAWWTAGTGRPTRARVAVGRRAAICRHQ